MVGVDGNKSSESLVRGTRGRPMARVPKGFQRQMTSAEQSLVLEASARLVAVCDELGVVYMLYGGALLGSYRHHDIVPWDDDVDLLVRLADRPRLRAALANLQPDYMTFEYGERLKFWSSAGSVRNDTSVPWHWPYVDVNFYDENATHIWDAGLEFRNYYVYHKSTVFPTHLRPFAGFWLPAPHDTLAFLVAMYPTKRHCSTAFYSHRSEQNMKSVSVKCHKMKRVYPFVHRRSAAVVALTVGRSQHVASSPGIVEVLMLGDIVVSTAHVEEPTYAIYTNPYVLPTRRRLSSMLSSYTSHTEPPISHSRRNHRSRRHRRARRHRRLQSAPRIASRNRRRPATSSSVPRMSKIRPVVSTLTLMSCIHAVV